MLASNVAALMVLQCGATLLAAFSTRTSAGTCVPSQKRGLFGIKTTQYNLFHRTARSLVPRLVSACQNCAASADITPVLCRPFSLWSPHMSFHVSHAYVAQAAMSDMPPEEEEEVADTRVRNLLGDD
jgi:hypothetical protein